MAKPTGRKASSLGRGKGVLKDSKETYLILCEGETEVKYFKDIKHNWRLSSVFVEKAPCSDPKGLVTKAKEMLKENKYDFIYSVFDCDVEKKSIRLAQELRTSQKGRLKNKLFEASSAPCFELWILLHYQYYSTPFEAKQQGGDK